LVAATDGALELIGRLEGIAMSRYAVVGSYTRFDESVRQALKDARARIVAGFAASGRRENHLLWAAPGSGKTYFVEQIAACDSGVEYRELNLAKLDEAPFRDGLEEVVAAGRPLLCLIDEVDAKPEAPWPYEVLMPCMDANLEGRGGLVFVLAGSSGSTLEEFRERIAARPKGADLLSRIPRSNCCVIAPMDGGDQALVAVSQMLNVAAESGRSVAAVERLALYYIARTPHLSNARQLREFAARAVARGSPADDRIRYDDLFDSGDPENKAFWASAMPAAESLVGSFVTVEGEPPPAGSAAPATRRPGLAPAAAAVEQPTGTVTFLFTDMEASTRLLEQLGTDGYADVLMEHRRLLRDALARHGGYEFGTEGDALFVAFASAPAALTAAGEMQAALAGSLVRVRMGIHSGEVMLVDSDYVGMAVHKAARICSAAHGGQVVVSDQTRALAGVALRNLGEHRLKDLTAPERLFQLGDAEFPPLRTLRHVHVPVQATPLIGREQELAELLELAGSHRLITLTGTGGTGKTRLALALAAELSDRYPDGQWWVSLATVTDPALVAPEIAVALGQIEDLPTYLRERTLLLVLDNLEQVIDAATAIGGLLAGAPGCAAIVTSRERLAVAGEQEYPVPPLSPRDAVELFTARARQVSPGFEPGAEVDAICERLDRLPLALELAATRVKLLSEHQLLARLEQRLPLLAGGRRDLPERQSTMRATIAWSYDLLSEPEQRLFTRLAVFAGSFTLEAAEAVCDAELDTLQSLIDKSLVRQGEHGRCFLLETTREYALERFAIGGEQDDIRARHARWYFALGLAVKGEGPGREAARTELRRDTANIGLALAWAIDRDIAAALPLADSLFLPWLGTGRLGELLRWYERALEDPAALSTLDRAEALCGLGRALSYTETLDSARAALMEALALSREADDERRAARALTGLGGVEFVGGSPERLIEWGERALEIYERLDDTEGVARSMFFIAEGLRDVGDFDRAAELYTRSIEMRRAHALDSGASITHSLGDLSLDRGDLPAADRYYREALTLGIAEQDVRLQAYCLAGFACLAARHDDARSAGRLWTLAERIERDVGFRMLAAERRRYERNLGPPLSDSNEYLAGSAQAAAEPDPLSAAAALLRT
jgi:predicted ATPase/class 3 adenylate cyclase